MKLPSLDTLRQATSPIMQLALIVMIAPLAIAIGMVEAFAPGIGVRFANGALTWVKGLPESFWLFAGAAYGLREIKRGYETHVEAKVAESQASTAESLVKAAEMRRQLDEEQAP